MFAILGQPLHAPMTKADLIEEVSRTVEVTRKDAEAIVETILSNIVEAVRKGEKVEIRGFGSFGNDPRNFYARGEYFQFAAPRIVGVSFSREFE